jgi:hypothetical protein
MSVSRKVIFKLIESGNFDVLKDISIDANLKVNYNKCIQSPLHLAVRKSQVEIVELFLSNGANAELMDEDEESSIDIAAGKGSLEMLKLFKIFGYDLSKNGNGTNPLFFALMKNQLAAARYLINDHNATLDGVMGSTNEVLRYYLNHNLHHHENINQNTFGHSTVNLEVLKLLEGFGCDMAYDEYNDNDSGIKRWCPYAAVLGNQFDHPNELEELLDIDAEDYIGPPLEVVNYFKVSYYKKYPTHNEN